MAVEGTVPLFAMSEANVRKRDSNLQSLMKNVPKAPLSFNFLSGIVKTTGAQTVEVKTRGTCLTRACSLRTDKPKAG
jgi:hypothetical protein